MQYFKTENLNRDERIFNEKINSIISWAKLNDRNDILSKADGYGEIRTMTSLKNAYYELLKMKKSEKNFFSNNTQPITEKSIPMTDTNSFTPEQQNGSTTSDQSAESSQPKTNSVDFDPLLSANPKQRDYTAGLAGESSQQMPPQGSIPEPDFKSEPSGGMGSIPQGEKDNRFSDLPPNEKAKGAKELAKVLVGTYANQTPALWKWISVPTKEINQAVNSQLLDLNVNIHTRSGEMPIGNYIESVKQQTSEAFVVTEAWQEEIMPYVERELLKRNMAISDIQVIGFMIAQDMLQKAVAAYGIRNEFKELIKNMVDHIAVLRSTGGLPNKPASTPPPPPANNSSTPPPPPPPPVPVAPEPVNDVVSDEPTIVYAEVVPNDLNQGMADDQPIPLEPYRGGSVAKSVPPIDEMERMPTVNGSLND